MAELDATGLPVRPTYEELQAEILRSVVVRQDFVSARNALDRDLERFQAIHAFSSRAIQLQHPRDLPMFAIEPAIESFEAECCAVFARLAERSALRLTAFQGVPCTAPECTLDGEWIERHGLERSGGAFIERAGDVSAWSRPGLHQVMVAPFYDAAGGLEGALVCGISVAKRGFYRELDDDALPSFMVFTQQAATITHNLQRANSSANRYRTCSTRGTGKELVARALHGVSPRSDRALIKVNCAALPAERIESELFGHERGAFTGAHAHRAGRFELADGETIFLDEIAELSPKLQARLLRVLHDREFERLGGERSLRVDVRAIAATNRDVEAAVAAGDFREDLYYRLNVFPIRCPPLRERIGDVPLLARHSLQRFSAASGKLVPCTRRWCLRSPPPRRARGGPTRAGRARTA